MKFLLQLNRTIRQRCGFGCVVCGSAIYEYEHLEPAFANAQIHDPDHIVLLCPHHHSSVTKGLLSKTTVAQYAADPKCKQSGFSFGPFDIGGGPPVVVLGTVVARNAQRLIRIQGDDVFWIEAPTELGRPFLLNAHFFDADDRPILDILENEWRSSSDNWDVQVVGARITINRGAGDLALVLRAEPPDRLVVERMEMVHRGILIQCQEGDLLKATAPDGSTVAAGMGVELDGSLVCFDVDEDSVKVGRGGTMRVGGPRTSQPPPMPSSPFQSSGGPRRNDPCPCGSGLRYKHCHGLF